ncbi:ABC transporter permease [Pseudonocardia sp. TRM90224]|uniref:ABC transporter permease n=1 Tax=Pseudonocardia sp. TRM90224 TaxID=2812678 RepID=UPI001E50E3C8|nr:ABC transporter permease [Pseudonocardia sp. TRM90224]
MSDRRSSTSTEPDETVAKAQPVNKGRQRAVLVRTAQILLAVVLIAGWEIGANTGAIDTFFFSQPSAIAQQVITWFVEGSIWEHLRITLVEALLALVIGTAAGLGFGFLLARVELLAQILDPYIKVLNSLPRVVLAPIFLLWFGLGIWSKVAFGVTLVFFIVFFNTYQGVREVNRVLVDNARMLGATESQLLRHVFLPSALSWIFSSLHVSVGFAIVGAVVGEYLGSSAGVGFLISQAEGVFDTTAVFAGMVVLSVVVLIIDTVVHRVERYLLRWRPTGAADTGAN